MLTPVISIVMPVFNCEATLGTAVQSILDQTFRDWELLILDDGSTDHTQCVAKHVCDPRIRRIDDGAGNLGLAARLNQGVNLARGRYIARMDGDDISFPDRLQQQMEFLETNAATDLVGCGMVIFKGDGEVVGQQCARSSHAEICGSPLRSCLLPHATWLGRSSWFKAHPYDPRLRRTEDRELLLRTRHVSRFAGLPQLLYGYRVNGVSLRENTQARCEYLRSLLRDAASKREWMRCCGAGAAELLKLGVDSIAFATHTDHWLLRHRATSLQDPVVTAQWQLLWSKLQSSVAIGEC